MSRRWRLADLIALWTTLGGTQSWSQWVDPTKLTIILLSCPCEKAHVATRADLLPPTGVKEAECIVVPEEEMRAFCSEVLARLPHLRKLRLYGCRTWPLDWNVCHNLPRPREIRVFFRDITKPWEKEVKDLAPFMKLECFGIIESAWTIDQAVESIAFLPGLKHPSSVSKGLYGFLLTRNYGPSDDELTGDGLFKDSSKFIQYV